MAKKTIIVSDLSDEEIRNPKDGAQLIIRYNDARRPEITLDVLAAEVEEFARKGQKHGRRGRRRRPASQREASTTSLGH